MRIYKCLKNQVCTIGDFSIVPIRDKDKYLIMNWRNEQIYHLRQNHLLTELDQKIYFQEVINKLFQQEQPSQILYSFLLSGNLIGYGGLVNIDWADKRAEVSFIIDTSLKKDAKKYKHYFANFLNMIKDVSFNDLNLNKIYSETYQFRVRHIKILEENGFVKEGRLKQHIFMEQDQRFYDSLLHAFMSDDHIN